MVIDKTTGIGCAWSMVSKTITKKLIAEGIAGKPIFRKQCKSIYRLFWVEEYNDGRLYITHPIGSKSADEVLWTPSFIEAKIWERGVSKFRHLVELGTNVKKYLLPEMGEYLQSIPEPELVATVRDFLVEHGVINTPITQRAGNTYFFNENEVYSLDENSKLFPYEKRIQFDLFNAECDDCLNRNLWHKAVSQFKVGMTLKECIGIFLKTNMVFGVPKDRTPIDQLVQSIAAPVFERVPENENKTTFDRIRITVGFPRYQFDSWETVRDEVKKYQPEIYRRVLQVLENDRQFKNYGIPIGFLDLNDVTLLRDFSMEFIFELKGQADPLLNVED